MTPFDPAELSAYLDGELPPARMAEIEALLARDEGLRAEYGTLKRQDAGWREAAAGGMFVPAVEPLLATPAKAPFGWLAAFVAGLVVVRIGGKFVEAVGPSLLLNLAALAVVGAVVLAMGQRQRVPGR